MNPSYAKASADRQELRIIFFGTPEFSVSSLKALIEANFNIVAVVTQPDKPVGRKKILTAPPVKILAEQNNIQVLQPIKLSSRAERSGVERSPANAGIPDKLGDSSTSLGMTNINFIDQIKSLKPDLFIIVAYGKILPQTLLDIPKHGSINIHPSLLPKYRGPSPLQAQILEDEKNIGVSIMLIDEEMDHGPILESYKLKVKSYKNHSYQTLGAELFKIGAKHLPKIIEKYVAGEIKPQEQDHSKATITKLIKKEDGQINWANSADYIERMTRAYYPWPSAFGHIKTQEQKNKKTNGLNIKILEARISKEKTDLKPGTLFKLNKQLAVVCGQGSILIIDELQISSKKKMTSKEFLRGHQI